MSAFFGALATGLTAMQICRSGSDMLRESRHTAHTGDPATETLICWVGGVVCSLLFAFSPVMWSQAIIVEVYSLNAFFLVLIFLLIYIWMRHPSDKVLYATAFVFGLGLTNYQALLLAALPLVIAVLLKDSELSRDFIIVGAPYAVALLLIRAGIVKGITHPTDTTCFVYMTLNFVVLILAWFLLPRGKTVALTFLLVEVGVAFYAYMPIVSDLRNPPMNWGYPRTYEGFKHAITRGQYERIVPTDMFSMRFIHQIGTYLTDLRRQFTIPIALLGFLPFAAWQMTIGRRRIRATYVAIALSVIASVFVVLEKAVGPGGSPFLSRTYKLFIAGVLATVVVGGMTIMTDHIRDFLAKLTGRTTGKITERGTVGLILLAGGAVYLYYVMMLVRRIVKTTEPLRTASADISSEMMGEMLLAIAGILVLMVAPVALALLVVWFARSRFQLRSIIERGSQTWVLATLVGFMSMGIMFIALANLKMDIQDTFIQRVKFISSHALYAFWIGYGLIFGLAFVDVIFRGNRVMKWLSLGTAMALPLVPLGQNAFNRELLRVYGGAEQNLHDFGWQFGNYQLRGAEAISEELDPDEEPLPNPDFPPEMEQDAVFFGGTDPGRFVPTYMIYSARVREDVFLITQNALADNTYMSVMRDLYGDQIWIPAQPDSTKAFQIYVREVQSGKRPRNAQLKIENGRVQVSGALGVMEINGILAKMIFDHNNYKHAFYVEESYVIPWMYPYLTPHGLIMKINPNKTPMPRDNVRDDLDFWDWYVRRFTDSNKFLRDVVARKSFSKLRSAIGGLYRSRGMLKEAEMAFQQARILYILSPEANFRLAQEVLVPLRRIAEARALMEEFGRQDPANPKVSQFLGHLDEMKKTQAKIRELEMGLSKGGMDVAKALQLASLYHKAGQTPMFMRIVMGIANNTNMPALYQFQAAQLLGKARRHTEMAQTLDRCVKRMPANAPPQVFLEIAKMYALAGKPDSALGAMRRYLELNPGDWKTWLNLAAMQIQLNKKDDAARSLEQAVRSGGNQAHDVIRKDRRFSAAYQSGVSRAGNLIGIPGVNPSPRR